MYTEIKTFEAACAKLEISTELPLVSNLPDLNQKAVVANYKLFVIAQALNEGWIPNWDNSSESKYYPWFDMSSSGSGFSSYDYVVDRSRSVVGSRLVFKSSELAKYAGTQFQDLYSDLFLI